VSKSNQEKRTNFRWIIALLMWAAITINFLDRTVLSAATPHIMKELHINPVSMGIVMSAFFWSYAAFQIPAGWLADRIGQRIYLGIAVIWWSIATALTALARSINFLICARIFMGIGEAGAHPCNAGITAKWFPDKERGKVTSFFDSGTKFGSAFAMPLVAWLIASYGWRIPFVICGSIGIVFAIIWFCLYYDPEEHKRINRLELEYIREGQVKKEGIDKVQSMKWYELLKYRNVIAMCVGFFIFNYTMYFFITWFPAYLVDERGMEIVKMGYCAMLPPICGIAGQWFGGFFTDFIYEKTKSLTIARKLNLVLGMLISVSIGFAGFAKSDFVALSLLCICYAGLAFAASAIWSLPGDIAPRNMTSVLGGIQNTASNCGGIIGPIVNGAIIGATGSYIIALIISGVCCFITALIYMFMLKDIKPIEAKVL
jgi:ACS family glucarate transporter-like MFS transporter